MVAGVSLSACIVALVSTRIAWVAARRARRDATGLRVMYDSALSSAIAWRGVSIELATPSGLDRDHVRRWCDAGCDGANDPGHLRYLPGVVFDLVSSVEEVTLP